MARVIKFTELRRIKDNLPDGTMHQIADTLQLPVETVRNYFGGANYNKGQSCGVHTEPGPDGGYVSLDDTTILDMALELIELKEV